MKKTRQQKAKRIMDLSNKRMLIKLKALGKIPIKSNDILQIHSKKLGANKIPHTRDTYVEMIGVDRLVRAWDLASIIL